MTDIDIVDYVMKNIIKGDDCVRKLTECEEHQIEINARSNSDDGYHLDRIDIVNAFNRVHAQCVLRSYLREVYGLNEVSYNIDSLMVTTDGDCDEASIRINAQVYVYSQETEY